MQEMKLSVGTSCNGPKDAGSRVFWGLEPPNIETETVSNIETVSCRDTPPSNAGTPAGGSPSTAPPRQGTYPLHHWCPGRGPSPLYRRWVIGHSFIIFIHLLAHLMQSDSTFVGKSHHVWRFPYNQIAKRATCWVLHVVE